MMFRPPIDPNWDKLSDEEKQDRRDMTDAILAEADHLSAHPEDLSINQEIMAVVKAHLNLPGGVDGVCACGSQDHMAEHGADVLISELAKAFNLPWKRVYDKKRDGAWPPSWVDEDTTPWRVLALRDGPFDYDEDDDDDSD